jgi:hypothetical protein
MIIRPTGTVDIVIETIEPFGVVIERQRINNLVVDSGLNILRDRIAGSSTSAVTHMAVGTGTTAVSAANTALTTETHRNAVTETIATNKVMTFKMYLASGQANGGGTSTLREIGLFNSASGVTMFARALLSSPITKSASVTVTFTWQIGFQATT